MSKILKPPGTLAREITIRQDTNGMIQVEAFDFTPAQPRGFRPTIAKTRMDSRDMVLVLLRVVTEYSTALFASWGGQKNGQPQENNSNATQDSHDGNAS